MAVIKNFLFDLYGTLIDIRTDEQSVKFWESIACLLNSGNGSLIKKRYSELCAQSSLPEGGEINLLPVMQALTEEFGSVYGASEFAKRFREASVVKLRLFGGAGELLGELRGRGAKLYLLSNAQACFTRYELEKLGLWNKFDGIMLSSEIGWKKPSQRFFEKAFEKFGLRPDECIYTGNDLRDDVEGARGAGMRSVYIPTAQSGKYGKEIPLDLSVSNHKELTRLLCSLADGQSI